MPNIPNHNNYKQTMYDTDSVTVHSHSSKFSLKPYNIIHLYIISPMIQISIYVPLGGLLDTPTIFKMKYYAHQAVYVSEKLIQQTTHIIPFSLLNVKETFSLIFSVGVVLR